MDRQWEFKTAKITATCSQFDQRPRRRGFGCELGVKVQTSPTVADRNAAWLYMPKYERTLGILVV